MRIVVLDGHTMNPGDLDASPLLSLGDVTVYPRTTPSEFAERAHSAEILVTNKVPISADRLDQLPNLKFIAVTATGYNIIDVAAARARSIPVSNVPAYSTSSVAQLTLGFILNFASRIDLHSQAVRHGAWHASPDFAFWNHPLIEVEGETLGIIGLGAIGKAVAKLAQAFGMHVVTLDRGRELPEGVEGVSLPELLARSRFISLHCPLTPDTKELVNADFLRAMRSDAFVINTARGPLIDQPALATALSEGWIAGAALDVLDQEPPTAPLPFLTHENAVVTPHIAWATQAARQRLLSQTVANIQAFLNGAPANVV